MRFTRREFSVALAGAALGCSSAPRRTAAQGAAVPASLQIGVQSFSFRKLDFPELVEALRSLELASVELWSGHLDPARRSEDEFRAARAALQAAGVRVSAYCVNFEPGASAELLERSFRGAGLLGTSLMTTSAEKSLLPQLEALCEKHGVTLGLHNHWLGDAWFQGDPAQNFEGPADFAQALTGRSPRLAINLDVGHFAAAGHDPLAYFREQHRRIVSLHLKDRGADPQHAHARFGRGATPLAPLLRLARELGFPHALNIEWELDDDPVEGVRDALAYVRRALA
jgi:sugar phosphate isomerase/epimerase